MATSSELLKKIKRGQRKLVAAASSTDPGSALKVAKIAPIKVDKNQIIKKKVGQLATNPNSIVAKTSTVQNVATADVPEKTEAQTYDPTLATQEVKDTTENFQAAQGDVSNVVEAAQGELSEEAKAEAAFGEVESEDTVRGQLELLMKDFDGDQTPAWAAGAMRKASDAMASRGLGASSAAGEAITQAAMESATAIAAADAQTYKEIKLSNLSRQTQVSIANAAQYAAMDLANLNNRQQAQVINAQNFLAMDLANLEAEQQTAVVKQQAVIQSILSDQAAENAAKQINAKNQQELDMFFSELTANVNMTNAAQKNAIAQFNAGEKNAQAQFNAELRSTRQMFETSNELTIAQANAKWRQDVDTINRAARNQALRDETLASYGITKQTLDNIWQRERDLMSFAFQGSENASDRALELMLADKQEDLLDKQLDAEDKRGLGYIVGDITEDLIGSWF